MSDRTCFDGMRRHGLDADRDAMPDVDVVAGLIEEPLEGLRATVPA